MIVSCTAISVADSVRTTGWPKKLHSEMCSRYLSKQINKYYQTHKIVGYRLQIHSEKNVESVLFAAGRHIPAGDATY